jgi:hypothetical protein
MTRILCFLFDMTLLGPYKWFGINHTGFKSWHPCRPCADTGVSDLDLLPNNMVKKRKRILFVPGKNPKPPEQAHRDQLWRCLLDGVRRYRVDAAHDLAGQSESFQLVSWNWLYYHQYKSLDADLPWLDRLLAQPKASERDRHQAHALRLRFARFLQGIADRLPALIKLLPDPKVKASIRETERYFRNEARIASQVRELLKQALREAFDLDQQILLIGHSMGSIIAYDALWEMWHQEHYRSQIDCFLTLGSPLGTRFVQHRLKGFEERARPRYPGNIRRWVNVSAQGDLVALDETMRDDFDGMLAGQWVEDIEDHCHGVYTWFRNEQGLNVHRSYGYLVHPLVGKIVADWWMNDSG